MQRDQIIKEETYLAYIRSLPCLACGKKPVDADHLKARGWREAKRNDYSAIPLCRSCHIERGGMGNERFCLRHGIKNLWEEVFYLVCGYLTAKREPSLQEVEEAILASREVNGHLWVRVRGAITDFVADSIRKSSNVQR